MEEEEDDCVIFTYLLENYSERAALTEEQDY